MRKVVSVGLTALLFAGTFTAIANAAAPKVGAKCAKLNQSQSANGSKFTCVKSGKKLVWKKSSTTPVIRGAAPTPTATVAPSPSATATPAGYTMDQVKTNNTATKCWSAINGNVYDLTNWINSHPGGPGAITSLCGTDGTSSFNGMHGGSGQPASRLSGYLLGPLNK